jgi:transcriptional regulator with XRE-family HTH domain
VKIDDYSSDDATLAELGARLRRARLAGNVTQAALAAEAGVGARTITRIEDGESTNVVNLIRVLRVLGLLDSLDALIPAYTVNPFTERAQTGRIRRRASAPVAGEPPVPGRWVWGDEQPVSDDEPGAG